MGKVLARFAGSYFLSKSRVVGGETDKSKSVRTFDDEEIDVARKAKAACLGSAITITEL